MQEVKRDGSILNQQTNTIEMNLNELNKQNTTDYKILERFQRLENSL